MEVPVLLALLDVSPRLALVAVAYTSMKLPVLFS